MFQGRHVEACVWFAALLNLKHIYVYVAPAYGVYLVRNYCFVRHRRTGMSHVVIHAGANFSFCPGVSPSLSLHSFLCFFPFPCPSLPQAPPEIYFNRVH